MVKKVLFIILYLSSTPALWLSSSVLKRFDVCITVFSDFKSYLLFLLVFYRLIWKPLFEYLFFQEYFRFIISCCLVIPLWRNTSRSFNFSWSIFTRRFPIVGISGNTWITICGFLTKFFLSRTWSKSLH